MDRLNQWKPTIDICTILVAAFKLNLHQKDNVVFSITLDKIDSELHYWQDSHETAKLAREQQENKSKL